MGRNTRRKYFRARDTKSFETIVREMNRLGKDEIKLTRFTNYSELYKYFLILVFIFLLAAVILENTYLRKLL